MEPEDFLKAIRKGKRFDILLLTGDEDYLIRSALTEYLQAAVDEATREFDYNEFQGPQVRADALQNAFLALPFMAQRRVIYLDAPHKLDEKGQEALKRFLQRPNSSTSLVMTAYNVERGEGLSSELRSLMTVVEFKFAKSEEARAKWAVEYAQKQGKTLTHDATRYLLESAGNGYSEIAGKLDHAILYLGEESEIQVQTLMKISGISAEESVFQLEDAILASNRPLALKTARGLLDGGEEILRLFAFNRSTLVRLWQVKSILRKKDNSDVEIKKIFPPRQDWKAHRFKEAAVRIGEPQILQSIVELLELEVSEKSSNSDTKPLYYEWLWHLTGSTKRFSGTRTSH